MPSHNRFSGQRPLGLTFWGQWFVAITGLIVLLEVLSYLKTGRVAGVYRTLGVLTVFCSIPIYSAMRVYDRRRRYLTVVSRITGAWLLMLAILAIIAFITKTGATFSREVLLQWTIIGFIYQTLIFIPLHEFSRRYHQKHQTALKSLIIGDGDLAHTLAQKLIKSLGEPVVGFVRYDEESLSLPPPIDLLPIIGSTQQLRSIIDEHDIRKIYIALPACKTGNIEDLYIDLMDVNVDVVWIPDITSLMLLNHSVSDVAGIPAINLNESPLTANPSAAFIKSCMDRVIALLALMVLSPIMLITAVAVKLSSPGPIIFKQPRNGWNGKVFNMWKFRSMKLHEDKAVKQASKNDPRVTPIGRFIRRTSIDELPQFFNVLVGDMSLVGPRPHAIAHNDYYSKKIQAYMSRLRIKPGITGLAQISGARGETDTLEKMERRVQLDLEYINKWSLYLDLKIILKTAAVVLNRSAY